VVSAVGWEKFAKSVTEADRHVELPHNIYYGNSICVKTRKILVDVESSIQTEEWLYRAR
jgi:hypothetical protein